MSCVTSLVCIGQKDIYGLWVNQRVCWIIIMNRLCHLITWEKYEASIWL